MQHKWGIFDDHGLSSTHSVVVFLFYFHDVHILWVYHVLWTLDVYVNPQQGNTYMGDFRKLSRVKLDTIIQQTPYFI